MNNKINLKFDTAPTFDTSSFDTFIANNVDELIVFSNDLSFTPMQGGATPSLEIDVDSFYIPEGLQSGLVTVTESMIRQDVKRKNAFRLSQATINQGLFIWSLEDNYKKYFSSSVKIDLTNLSGVPSIGYIRYGFCNFTATQANNPFTTDSVSANNWYFSFFDIEGEM